MHMLVLAISINWTVSYVEVDTVEYGGKNSNSNLPPLFLFRVEEGVHVHARIHRGGTWGPVPQENHKAIGCHITTPTDPWKIIKLPSRHLMLARLSSVLSLSLILSTSKTFWISAWDRNNENV